MKIYNNDIIPIHIECCLFSRYDFFVLICCLNTTGLNFAYKRSNAQPFITTITFITARQSEELGTKIKFSCYEREVKKKLDGVGPVDNRPSTDKLHHSVPKKQKNKKQSDT